MLVGTDFSGLFVFVFLHFLGHIFACHFGLCRIETKVQQLMSLGMSDRSQIEALLQRLVDETSSHCFAFAPIEQTAVERPIYSPANLSSVPQNQWRRVRSGEGVVASRILCP